MTTLDTLAIIGIAGLFLQVIQMLFLYDIKIILTHIRAKMH